MTTRNTEGLPEPFLGFDGPNYTQVPDALFDELLPYLSGSEVKVLLYIIRRTFGFKRERDTISLSQMLTGITTHKGVVLDRGTGLSKPSLLRALRSLREKHIIIAERRSSADRGDRPTEYHLNVRATPRGKKMIPPLVKKVDQGGGKESSPGPWSTKLTTQETGEQETEEQNTYFEYSNIRKGHPGKAEKGSAHSEQTAPEPELDAVPPSKGPESIGTVLSRRTRAHRSTSRPRPETETDEYQRIQVLITDRAREFADNASLKASTTRAWNLYQAAGQSISTFESKLFQARALTQEATSRITNTVEDATYRTRRKSKMAYFFATLEDLLGLRPHDPEPEPEANPPTASAPEATKPRRAKRTKTAPAEPETLPLDLTQPERRADDGELSGLWRGVLSELARSLTKSTYNQWLAPTRLVAITDEIAIVVAADERAADWLASRMATRIQPMLSSRAGRSLDLRFQVERGGE